MEAATPLRKSEVRTLGDRLVIDGLVVTDESAVRLVREREKAGDDTVKAVIDAIEIGARVLDREQAGANADFVRAEFGKTAREVETSFTERARQVSEELEKTLAEAFGPESGHVTKALERHFSDGSSAAVQHRVKEVVAEVMQRSREDLVRQFSADGDRNPLADFKASTVRELRTAAERQDNAQRALLEKMAMLEKELQGLRDERRAREELEAEHDRGSAKGREYEDVVYEAIDRIAQLQGDDCDAVGDTKGATRKTGDVLVAIDACRGPARGRVIFEAKNKRLSKPEAMRELDRGLEERDAQFAVLVVPSEDKVPAKTHSLREYQGDKLVVTYDPDEGNALALEVAYSLARAKVLMKRAESSGVDTAAVNEAVDRAQASMEDVRRVKQQLTGARTSIDKAEEVLDAMAKAVRAQLEVVDSLTRAESDAEDALF